MNIKLFNYILLSSRILQVFHGIRAILTHILNLFSSNLSRPYSVPMVAGNQNNQASGAPSLSSFYSQLNFNLPVKLARNNYFFWKAHVLPTIIAFNLEDYIFATKPAPKV
ncbi:hypothetical protein ACOSP7_004460 [Xanthoceras sorbifolium]